MKKLLGLAVAVAGMTFGVSNASANPCVGVGSCVLFDGNGLLDLTSPVTTHIVTTPSGNINFWCKGDVTPPPNGAAHFDFSSTGFSCFLGCPVTPGSQKTTDWKEVVSASGEATLQCHIHK
jgi:hypothetical protein